MKRRAVKREGSTTAAELERAIMLGIEHTYEEDDRHLCYTYVLNPREHRDGPAFAQLDPERDAELRAKAGALGELSPAWMGRFIALTETEVVFGWILFNGEHEHERIFIHTVAFNYAILEETHGARFAKRVAEVPRAHLLPSGMLYEALNDMAEGLSPSSIRHSQALQTPAGGALALTRGGSA